MVSERIEDREINESGRSDHPFPIFSVSRAPWEVSHPSGGLGLLPHIRLDACSRRDVIRPCACTYALLTMLGSGQLVVICIHALTWASLGSIASLIESRVQTRMKGTT